MSVFLSISSQVVRGHVGNSAIAPGLRALGHEVWPMPTIVLSNHPGHGGCAGPAVSAEQIAAMVGELERHGWLSDCAGVMSGYFRDAAQCAAAAYAVRAVKQANPRALYLCDPVLGDDPGGLYVPEDVAAAVRDELVPLADLITPNCFELAWLSGREVTGTNDAVAAAGGLQRPGVIVTSIYSADGPANLWVGGESAISCRFEPLPNVPHGVGDLFAALALVHLVEGDGGRALGLASAQIAHVIARSAGRDELDMAAGTMGMATVAPLPVVGHASAR
jgi:pyridoxine kinase